MFTGLIEEIGEIAEVKSSGGGITFTIIADAALEGTRIGDSISINGACLTVTSLSDGSFTVFASSVTASATALGSYAKGKRVNLERAMTPAARFGGHFVQGHVDGTGKVERVKRDSMGAGVGIAVGHELKKYIAGKGSVAVDGISLTVVSVTPSGFFLYVIPETLVSTVAADWKPGDAVNVEVDIIAKYVERMLSFMKGGGDIRSDDGRLMKKLADEGFV